MISVLNCPQCNSKHEFEGRYEDMFDKQLECPKCRLTISGFCFDFVKYIKEAQEGKDEV